MAAKKNNLAIIGRAPYQHRLTLSLRTHNLAEKLAYYYCNTVAYAREAIRQQTEKHDIWLSSSQYISLSSPPHKKNILEAALAKETTRLYRGKKEY
jgi:hypothetical protein